MTTTSTPQDRTFLVLRAAAAWGLTTLVIAVAVAALTTGRAAVLSVVGGGGTVVLTFLFGMIVVGFVTRIAPAASLLVALVTYLLQIVVLAAIALRLAQSSLAGRIDEAWLVGGIIAVTFAWIGGAMFGAARIPLTPVPLPSPTRPAPAPEAGVR